MLTDEEIGDLVFKISLKSSVLEEYDEAIADLLRVCDNQLEIDVVMHLLEQLHLPSLDQIPAMLTSMADFARELLQDDKRLAIVAMAYDGSADGSQTIIQLLKPKLGRSKSHKIFNSVPQYLKSGGIDEFPRYLLVDDFMGSGQTVLNRVKEIGSNAKGRKIVVEPHICLLYGMEQALQKVQNEGLDIRVVNSLRAGLSGHFSGNNLNSRVEAIRRIETQLAPIVDGVNMPSLGYNEAEATFCIRDTNAPNSNFPIFWWPEDASGSERHTLMVRAEL